MNPWYLALPFIFLAVLHIIAVAQGFDATEGDDEASAERRSGNWSGMR